MSLTGKDIAEIAKLLDESRFSSLDLEMGEFRLRIRRDAGGRSPRYADDEREDNAPPPPSPAPKRAPSSAVGADEVDVPAPLLGNFYSAPRPGDPPFVEVGDRVEEDTTIGIIEVMKLMNPIRAGVAGTVIAVLAPNGVAVEEGQPLIRVKSGG